ncbi:unnamed protein product [Cuscuta europaea]|uniref:HMG box domain-containing protein n=1 Tax=Cuscuta europaea TaxID=41803 RepID=A0A9P0ZPH3_CUSEU|nr:unnamed protein product [Cuscuta europaea]
MCVYTKTKIFKVTIPCFLVRSVAAISAKHPLDSSPSYQKAMDAVPEKKENSRKALKPQRPSSSEANIMAGVLVSDLTDSAFPSGNNAEKENHESFLRKNPKKGVGASKAKKQKEDSSFEKAFYEMQEKLEKLKIEKEHTEELLKARDEMILQKEKEQEKLQSELKKLQKTKEFKPILNFPILMGDRDQKKKEKKVKDPRKKKPATAYLLWCKDQWNEVKKENPKAEFKEVTNLLAAKWKTISAEEKKPYEEKYQSEKEMYLKMVGNDKREHEALRLLEEEQKQKIALELLEQYIQFQQQEAHMENKKKKKEKDPLKPKKPMSAFFLFSNERRTALLAENKNAVEAAKIMGEEWRNLTDEQKAPYEEVAAKNREQFEQEMRSYQKKKEEEAAFHEKEEEEMMKIKKQEAMQLLKKKEKVQNLIKKTKDEHKKKQKEDKKRDPNKPKKPASSFLLFSKEERKKIVEEKPGTNTTSINAIISIKWKELSEEEKQVWSDKAAQAMEAYKKELEEYNNKAKEINN